VPHLLASGGVYQAAIAGGQAFLLLGLLVAFDAVTLAQGQRQPSLRLVLAGTAWALALGSRVSLGPAIACLIVATALGTGVFAGGGWKRTLFDTLRLGLPVAFGLGALLLYNKLRFESFFEFGTNNQLSTIRWRTSLAYVPPNLYSYLLRPFKASCEFPFVLQQWHLGEKGLPSFMKMPKDYFISEPVVGWVLAVPLAWLIVVALARLLRRPRAFFAGSARNRLFVFCLLSFAIVGSVSGIAETGLYMATMRFLSDVGYGIVLLGILGGFALYAGARSAATRLLAGTVFGLLAALTVVLGLLLGYQGYNGHFHLFHPDLDARLVEAFSTCKR
jgi:hypothetical protein